MALTTHENYITETVLVPLYNRSAGLRKLISKKFSKKFGTKVDFGSSIQYTGDTKKGSNVEKYGSPDATSDTGNYIEVKINYDSLTESEGNGKEGKYKRYLREHKDKYLLYIVPVGYEDDFVKERSLVMTWDEILDYLIEHDERDPLISIIYSRVEVSKMKEAHTIANYEKKIYRILIKAMEKEANLHISLSNDDESNFRLPNDLGDDADFIQFSYEDKEEEQFCIYLEKTGMNLCLPQEFNNIYKEINNQDFKLYNDDWLRLEIISCKDFWNKTTDTISDLVVKKLKTFINVYEQCEKKNK